MRLNTGDAVPLLATCYGNGRPILAHAYRRRKGWPADLRSTAYPVCNRRGNALIRPHAAWQFQGLQPPTVFQSPPEHLRPCAHRPCRLFPLPPDPGYRRDRLGGAHPAWIDVLKEPLRPFFPALAPFRAYFSAPKDGAQNQHSGRLPACARARHPYPTSGQEHRRGSATAGHQPMAGAGFVREGNRSP